MNGSDVIRHLAKRATYANIVSTIALLVAVGTGTVYAAATIGSASIVDNSIRSIDVRDNTLQSRDIGSGQVRSSDVLDGSLRASDFVGGVIAPTTGNLPTGVTLRGNFDVAHATDDGGPLGQGVTDSFSFGFTLPSAPTIHYLRSTDPPTTDCPGSPTDPQAAAGTLCFYETYHSANCSFVGVARTSAGGDSYTIDMSDGSEIIVGTGKADRWGFAMSISSAGTSNANEVSGTWAVTS